MMLTLNTNRRNGQNVKNGLVTMMHNSALYQSSRLLSQKDLRKVSLVIIIQSIMGLIDLAGIGALGILGSLTVSGIQSKAPGDRVFQVLEILGLENLPFQTQVIYLGIGSALLLLSRTVFSVMFTRKTLFFLSHKSAKASSELIAKLFTQPFIQIQKRETQRTLFAVTEGVSKIMLGVIGNTVTIISDSSLLFVIFIGLVVVDPILAIGTLLVFSFIGLILYTVLNQRVKNLGKKNTDLFIKSNEKILEVLSSYREAVIRNRREFYARQIGGLRLQLGNVLAENAFVPFISKYVIESSIVFGALLISAIQFFRQDAAQAIATLTIFLAAGMRIAPAVLRIQQGLLAIKGNISSCATTFEMIRELGDISVSNISSDSPAFTHEGFFANIEARDVSYRYPEANKFSISDLSLSINQGSFVGIVGPTGAGKTTAADLLLGILEPHKGEILISGLPAQFAITKWPGAIAYVPQDIVIINGTLRENVGLGFESKFIDDEMVWESIKSAQLLEYVQNLPNGLDTQVGERGTKMSGGQRQRLGIARALFTRPRLLILDEATSSLDGDTENAIAKAINNLKGKVTVIMIAHRLSTIRKADEVVYLHDGRALAKGSFDEVRNAVPDFDRQARLMGL